MLQNNAFLSSNFERIFFVLASENDGKIEKFEYFYRKHRFCKIIAFPRENHYFSWLGASKNLPKLDAQTQWKKNSKTEFGKPFGLPKSLKTNPKSDVKRSLFRDAMEIKRTSPEITGRRTM